MTDYIKNINFSIDHIDPLGQGVSKLHDQITFIPKTLPGEKGRAIIYKKSKGVNFASTTEEKVLEKSDLRVKSPCHHYDYCQGCHFLHCSHDTELDFKKSSLERMMHKINPDLEIEVISLDNRFHYRNRIQLHYDVNKKEIGFINKYTNKIHKVNECLLPDKKISEFLQKWYQSKEWMILAKTSKPKGHVELILVNGEVEVHWNKRYSSGGFTQVNEKMNQLMLEIVHNLGVEIRPKLIIDLFAGNGNLTNSIKEVSQAKRFALDLYPHGNKSDEFITANLDELNSLENFKSTTELNTTDLLVVDPPRKGFKQLQHWSNYLSAQNIIYVSCNPATLVRDLQQLDNYKIEKVFLLDMFACTYHFETIVVLKKF